MSEQAEPAFPCNWVDFQPNTGDQVVREQYFGLTIRDYFAAKAIAPLMASGEGAEKAARHAYEMADAMLKARKGPQP